MSLCWRNNLTQLHNQRLLNDRLQQAMSSSKRSGYYSALLSLALDNFKTINDTYGHDSGDLLLIEAAQRISKCVGEINTVARFGGDEFVIIINNLDIDKKIATEKAYIVAEKIRSTLEKPYSVICKKAGNEHSVFKHHSTSSIGVVLFINHNASKEDILKWADIAMYDAKADGRNKINFFENV
jgi:diguanylate cyclase (GGDEF) domain